MSLTKTVFILLISCVGIINVNCTLFSADNEGVQGNERQLDITPSPTETIARVGLTSTPSTQITTDTTVTKTPLVPFETTTPGGKSNNHPTATSTPTLPTPEPEATVTPADITLSPTPSLTPTTTPEQANGLSIDDLIQTDPDSDGDSVPNLVDNCPFIANPDQADENMDGIGDVCLALEHAKQDLAIRLGGVPEVLGIGVEKVEEVIWPDSCLGAADANEACLAVETPGYRIIFEVSRQSGQMYQYHTDRVASFRFVGKIEN